MILLKQIHLMRNILLVFLDEMRFNIRATGKSG